jgi:hypothetical protein
MKIHSYILITCWILLTIALFVLLVYEFNGEPNYANICTAICTYGLVITAIYGFHSNKEAIRMQTSTDFCVKIYNILQSDEFVKREQLIWERLENQENEVCAIDEVKDEELREAMIKYGAILNGIGVFIVERMINPDIVLAYIGANTLHTFMLIKPYLEKSRQKRYDSISDTLPLKEKKYIKEAQLLIFAHFELLALEIEKQAPYLIQKYQKLLQRANLDTGR